MTTFRMLGPGDEIALEAFLLTHVDSSMFLRSNLRDGGLVYQGKPYQADYMAKVSGNQILGVAAHLWNGNLMLQMPEETGELMQAFGKQARRSLKGLVGPHSQVASAREALGLSNAPATWESHQNLFSLHLSQLTVPEALQAGRFQCRHSRKADLDLLIQWRVAYMIEAINEKETPALWSTSREAIERNNSEGSLWVLLDGGRLVSMSAFNASLPDSVQVGGVWTPPELRSRGYARCAVAGSLLEAREKGAERAILFTEDAAARRTYLALGFRIIGDYCILQFDSPQNVGDQQPSP
ncbi:MAG: GNAT family N-acetyltransferase [Acidobacteria bacterium]|nr:GNAT family N-acetyltransferase [Acidobacteriota bacterium]